MKLEYNLYKLDNGLQVLLVPTPNVNSITVHALIKSGAALENEKTQGITHVVEHMALTCTESWPTKENLNTVSEFVGGNLNGSTGKESLEYYITLPYTKMDFGIKVIYEVLYKSLLTEKNLKTEKTVIIDEINSLKDNVNHQNTDFIYKERYGKGDIYTLDLAGTKEIVESFTLEDIKNHYHFSHSPNKVTLALTGNFNENEARKIIKETFGTVKYKETQSGYPTPRTNERLVKTQASAKTNLIFADMLFKYKGMADLPLKERLSFDLTRSILAGPMSSRLKKRLREEEGLLYDISMGSVLYHNFGELIISYETEPSNFEKCFTILNEELEKFYDEGITEQEVNHYREYLINKWLLRYDDPKSYSRLIKYPVFLGLPVYHLDEMVYEMKNLTTVDINKFIKENLDLKHASYFAFGNIGESIPQFMNKNNKNL